MAGINKKTWKTKNGIKYYYEITYYENGKQKKKGGYKSKLEAQIALKDVVTERNTEITLNKLSQQYLERHCTLNCKNSTITLYESYLKTIEPLLRLKAKDITKRHIENLILELKTRDMSNKSINGIVTFIQAILNYAVDNELISNNPIIRLKKLPQVKPPINFLNETQIEVFLQQAETCSQTYKAFFYTAIFTGMRRGELLALEWSDIDFKQNKIRVNKQIYRGITQTTKTGKERYIDMSERLKDVLIEHKLQGILSKYVFHINGKP
jgi:integrase